MGEIVMLQKDMQYVDLSDFFSEESSIKLPLLGTVAAGTPILAEENIEEYLSVPQSIVRNDVDGFLLRVKGDSSRKEISCFVSCSQQPKTAILSLRSLMEKQLSKDTIAKKTGCVCNHQTKSISPSIYRKISL